MAFCIALKESVMEDSVMKNPAIRQHSVKKFHNNSFAQTIDPVAAEVPLTIYVNGAEFATLLCTPSFLEELVTGFLASEGLIRSCEDIKSLSIDESKGFAYVELHIKLTIDPAAFSKRVIGSCCGKSRQFYFRQDVKTAKTTNHKISLSAEKCIVLMERMQQESGDFQLTGGLHNGALCTADELLISRSDIGRHNALDKIFGHCLINRIPVKNKVIVFSGRISSEVLLKVSKIGIAVLLSKSAPTSLGIDLAEDLGITTAGFVREGRMNVYSRPERILHG
jgi:FdhD protein